MTAPEAPTPALPEQDECTLRILASAVTARTGAGPEAEAAILAAWRATLSRIDETLA